MLSLGGNISWSFLLSDSTPFKSTGNGFKLEFSELLLLIEGGNALFWSAMLRDKVAVVLLISFINQDILQRCVI